MKILKKDGIVFLINAIIFVGVLTLDINALYTIALILGLLVSYFFFKQVYSSQNILKIKNIAVDNVTGIILTFLFAFNLVLSWNKLSWLQIAYIILFCLIQILNTQIYRT